MSQLGQSRQFYAWQALPLFTQLQTVWCKALIDALG